MPRSHIFTRQFWRDYWIALRRSRKDSRDRKTALFITIWLVFAFVYYGGYLWYFAHDAQTRIIFFVFAIVLTATFGGRWFFLWLDEQNTRRDSAAAVNPTLRKRFAADAFTLAILLARNGSERYLREKELPANLQITTRRHHLDQLRNLQLWEALPAATRNLLLLPDGHWPPDALNLWHSFECLRCLRWVLRLDDNLHSLTHLPRMDYNLVHALTDKPNTLFAPRGMQDIWDIRIERVAADHFFTRCFAELSGRGLLHDTTPKPDAWLTDLYNNAREPTHRDTLVQHNTVAELDEPTLRYLTGIAWNRYHALQHLMDLIDNPDDETRWRSWTQFCFPSPEPPIENPMPS